MVHAKCNDTLIKVSKEIAMGSRPSFRVFLVGLLGGAADAIPGISGATVYYVLGIYEEMLNGVKRCWGSLISAASTRTFQPVLTEPSWKFISTLAAGVIVSFFIIAKGILLGLEHPTLRAPLLSIFFGLVLGSSSICLQSISVWKLSNVLGMALGILLGIVLMSGPELGHEPLYTVPIRDRELPQAHNVSEDGSSITRVPHSALIILKSQGLIADEDTVVDNDHGAQIPVKNLADGDVSLLRLDLLASGLLAASAVLLPGLSGSYVLNVLGVYGSIISAFLDLCSGLAVGEFRTTACLVVANIVAGAFVGVLLFSQSLLWILDRFHDRTHAFLSGCMIGSMWSIWPYQSLAPEIDPFHISDGAHMVSVGNYVPSFHEMKETWYLPCLIIASTYALILLHRFASTQKSKTYSCQQFKSSSE
jgi:uncharacterized membrane protein